MRKGVTFLILINIIILSALNSGSQSRAQNNNYIASNYFTLSVFRNFRGFTDWKKDFLAHHKKFYKKVQLNNYNDVVLKLKNNIEQQITTYKRDKEAAKYFDRVLLPIILIKRSDQPEKKIQIYCNGITLKPLKWENLGEVNVKFEQEKKGKLEIKTSQNYNLFLFTFSDFIANQNITLSLKNELDLKRSFDVGQGILVKDLFISDD